MNIRSLKRYFLVVLLFGIGLAACTSNQTNTEESTDNQEKEKSDVNEVWKDYFLGNILFEDKAPQSEGSRIYHRLIPDPQSYIAAQARAVLHTLYWGPQDSIVSVNNLHYSLEDIDGISAKGGGNGEVTVFYSTRHVERSFADKDSAKVDFETRGVLYHELTHAYQLEPQGIGTYGTNKVFWAFIEGMADAVRVANGGFQGEADRPKGGNYDDGYRTTGYFLVWVRDHKDADFLRKFNRTALEVIPWSFEGAFKKIFGENCNVADLWKEYQIAVGDLKE